MSDLSVIKSGANIVILWNSVGGISSCGAPLKYNVQAYSEGKQILNKNVQTTSLSEKLGVSGEITVTIASFFQYTFLIC